MTGDPASLGAWTSRFRMPRARLSSFLLSSLSSLSSLYSSLFSSLFSALGPAALAPILALVLCGASLSWLSCAQVADAPARSPVDYVREIRPILEEHCYQCHGGEVRAPSGRLRLDTRQAASKGGRSGEPAIVPGKSAASPLPRHSCVR